MELNGCMGIRLLTESLLHWFESQTLNLGLPAKIQKLVENLCTLIFSKHLAGWTILNALICGSEMHIMYQWQTKYACFIITLLQQSQNSITGSQTILHSLKG